MTGARRLEARIAALSGRAACVLTGSAGTAISIALQIVHERSGPGEVIVPAITCPVVAQVVEYAGMTPVFADVDVPECTMSVAGVRARLNERTRAILPTHIFGYAAPIAEITELAVARGVAIVEDVAMAPGGTAGTRPLGSFGDFSVHSFGGSKILTAGGGGALVTDDLAAADRARTLLAALPPLVPNPRDDLKALSHRNFTHGLTDMLRVDAAVPVGAAFRTLTPAYRDHFLRALADDSPLVGAIDAELDALPANLEHRRSLASAYHAGLSSLGARVQLPQRWDESGVVWRYTFLTAEPAAALAVTRALRHAGLDASNHYWSVAQLMLDELLPFATYVSPRLINLWVDPDTTRERAEAAIEIIRCHRELVER